MQIKEITAFLESLAPLAYQESYDNAGLITGSGEWNCTGVLVSLDATPEVIEEAASRGCNLVVSHHPIVFGGIKKLNGKNYVEKAVILAVKQDIALYAIHTNLDNVLEGVNGRIASLLGLEKVQVLSPKAGFLKKLITFVPGSHLDAVRDALFEAGGGEIGRYSECSFTVGGTGSYRPGSGTRPFAGTPGQRHLEPEMRLELIYPAPLETALLRALRSSHPYEEIAFDLVPLSNVFNGLGAGCWGELPQAMEPADFLGWLKTVFRVPVIRHSAAGKKPIKRVALCGGAGSFLVNNALGINADAYITADLKYHEFFDANDRILLADPGHFETEQFTIDLLYDVLAGKFPTFAVFKTVLRTNPVNYYI